MLLEPKPAQVLSGGEVTPELQAIIYEENAVIDESNEQHFLTNLVTTEFGLGQTPEQLRAFQELIDLELRERRTMADVFALFVSDDYAGKLNSLDLGKTKHPNDESEIVRLRSQYRLLRESLVASGAIEAELKRDEAGIGYRFRQPSHNGKREGSGPKFLIGVRERPLITATVAAARGDLDITVKKRMTFAMASRDFARAAHATGAQHESDPCFGRILEPLLDGNVTEIGTPPIYPIRTVYYVANRGFEPVVK